VFVRYSGHVKTLNVTVYENYNVENESQLLRDDFYTDFKHDTKKNYTAIKLFLQTKIDEYIAI
jgi:hypothetical protein